MWVAQDRAIYRGWDFRFCYCRVCNLGSHEVRTVVFLGAELVCVEMIADHRASWKQLCSPKAVKWLCLNDWHRLLTFFIDVPIIVSLIGLLYPNLLLIGVLKVLTPEVGPTRVSHTQFHVGKYRYEHYGPQNVDFHKHFRSLSLCFIYSFFTIKMSSHFLWEIKNL